MALSERLTTIVAGLPLAPGMRVLEIGCGPGAMAREISAHVGPEGHVRAVDRSERAIAQVRRTCASELADGRMSACRADAEDLVLEPGEAAYDLVVAVRVGALDGRHPRAGEQAMARISALLAPGGRLFVDGDEVQIASKG